ncbi:hypothetical protein [Rubritalea tangerina]
MWLWLIAFFTRNGLFSDQFRSSLVLTFGRSSGCLVSLFLPIC